MIEKKSHTNSARNTPSANFLGSGAVYALASIAPMLSTLAITPVVTRLLGATQYGLVGVSITLYQVGAVVLALGLPFAITRHAIIARSGPAGASALVILGALATGLGGVVLLSLLPAWGHLVFAEQAAVLAWPVISSVGLAVLTLGQSFFRAVDRVVTFVVLGIMAAILAPLCGFLSILWFGSNASSFLAGLALGHLASGFLSLTIVVRHSRPKFSRREALGNLRIALPTLPHSVSISFLVSALVVLTSRVSGLEDAGRLQLALLLGTAPMILLGAFNNAWAPMVYRATDRERGPLLASSLRAVSVIVLILTAGFCVLAQPVVFFIAGSELFNRDLLIGAIIVTAATPFMALYLANIHLVFLSGKTMPLAGTTPLSLVLTLAIVAAITSAMQEAPLVAFAAGIPLFHALQWMMSTVLCHFTSYDSPRIAKSLPILGASLACSIVAGALLPSSLLLAGMLSVVCAFFAFMNRSILIKMVARK